MSERTIFLTALEKNDPAERLAYLDEACAGDESLRSRVEGLLRAQRDAGSFLQESAPEQVLCGVPQFPGHAASADCYSGASSHSSPDAANSPQMPTDRAERDDTDLSYLEPAQTADGIGRLGHYEVLHFLGKGGFGIVLKAFDQRLHRVVAIKVLSPHLAGSGTARKRFLREARAAAAIHNDHVVDIHAVEESPLPFLVMEFVAGSTLQNKVDVSGPLALEEILRIGFQTACGLAAAHAQGLVHRDIKPANILLENGVERVKITDFGLARAADDASLSQSGFVAGTPMYMAPEQAAGEPLDHRADLFSLGSTLYTLCTGHPPFRASGTLAVLKRVVEDRPRAIREINPEIPQWLCDVIARLLAKAPKDRYASAQEVADRLERGLAGIQGHAGPQTGEDHQAAALMKQAPPESPWSFTAPAGAKQVAKDASGSRLRLRAIGATLLVVTIIAGTVLFLTRLSVPIAINPLLSDALLILRFEKNAFYEKDGSTYIHDLSGNGNDALCQNIEPTSDGKSGDGLLCQGGGLRFPRKLINRLPEFTIAGWIYPDQGQEFAFFCERFSEREPNFGVFVNEAGVFVNAWNRHSQEEPWREFHASLPAGSGWQFIAVRLLEGGTDRCRVKVTRNDRTLVGALQMEDAPPGQASVALQSFGRLDEFVILPRALSDDELRELWHRGRRGQMLAPGN